MVRFQVDVVPLDGTNDVPYQLTVPAVSLQVFADTTTLTLQVRPGSQSAFVPLSSGRVLSLEPVQPGERISPTVLTLRATAALTAYVVTGYP